MIPSTSIPRDENGTPLQETYKTLVSGQKNVTTAGTPVQLLTASTECKRVQVVAKDTNAGNIYIGGSTTLASTKTGIALTPLGSFNFGIIDVSLIWIDADTSGDGVSFVYFD